MVPALNCAYNLVRETGTKQATNWCKIATVTRARKETHIVYTTKSLQSCPTLCDPIDSSPPGSPVPGILQARTLEWVVISFSNAWKWKFKVKSLSHVQPSATPWTAAYQAPPSMGFSRQEYWSGVPLPSPHIVYIELKIRDMSPLELGREFSELLLQLGSEEQTTAKR